MKNDIKRRRGRPVGSGKKDVPTLDKMADLIAADSKLKVTPAIRRVLGNPDAATVRRLQVKWQAGSAAYLAEARARRTAASVPVRQAGITYSPRMARQIAEAQRKVSGMLGTGAWENSTSAALSAAYDNPSMKAMREAYDSPAMRAARALYDDPTMRVMRELQNSPEMRVAREMEKIQRLMRGGF